MGVVSPKERMDRKTSRRKRRTVLNRCCKPTLSCHEDYGGQHNKFREVLTLEKKRRKEKHLNGHKLLEPRLRVFSFQ